MIEREQSLKKLGQRIRDLRKKQGYSSYETFAFKKNLPRSQVGRWENGEDDLKFTSLLKIIDALEVTVEEFFEGWSDQKVAQ